MSVGVVGAGIFGMTAALELSALDADVTIYERRHRILAGASGRNFFRVHRGYHYPRDVSTAVQARDGYRSFVSVFGNAITSTFPNYYAIAAADSHVGPAEFESHCDHLGLRITRVSPDFLARDSIVACYEVEEAYYDARLLRQMLQERLSETRVRLELSTSVDGGEIARRHDYVVVAAYDSMSAVLAELDCPTPRLQYELCEVAHIVCREFPRCSVVVMDGPFTCIAPYSGNRLLLYDVVNGVHERVVTDGRPEFPRFRAELEGPPASSPTTTRFDSMLTSARRYMPVLANAEHVASFYSQRVVLPDVDDTDARPTLVGWVAPEILAIFSGKVSVAIDTARTVARAVASRAGVVITREDGEPSIATIADDSAS